MLLAPMSAIVVSEMYMLVGVGLQLGREVNFLITSECLSLLGLEVIELFLKLDPPPSGGKGVPALVLGFSRSGGVGAGGSVVVSRELVVASCTGVLEGDTPAVRGAEAPDLPAVFNCGLEKFDGILV